jgi:hypothetical protein
MKPMSKSTKNTENTPTDPDDAPELEDEFFKQADQYDGEVLVKPGRPLDGGMKTPS